jgi:hypothetical protein
VDKDKELSMTLSFPLKKKHVPETLALAFMLVPHKTGWTGGGIRGEGGA